MTAPHEYRSKYDNARTESHLISASLYLAIDQNGVAVDIFGKIEIKHSSTEAMLPRDTRVSGMSADANLGSHHKKRARSRVCVWSKQTSAESQMSIPGHRHSTSFGGERRRRKKRKETFRFE